MGSQNGAKGKRYKPKPYRITFDDDHPYAGLEVIMRRASVDTVLGMMADAGLPEDAPEAELAEARAEAELRIVRHVADLVTWWNVDDEDDRPVTPDEAGVRSQDYGMVTAIFHAWRAQALTVPPPLRGSSPDGPGQEEPGSIPMEPLPPPPES